MRDYYRILGLGHNATSGEIHSAYRGLARRYHPDRNSDPDAAEHMAWINEAYKGLSDDSSRSMYDQRFVAAEPVELQNAVLEAARDGLRPRCRRWNETGGDPIIEVDDLRIVVRFLGLLGVRELEDWKNAIDPMFRRNLVHGAVCVAYRVFVADEFLGLASSSASPLMAIDLVQACAYDDDRSVPNFRSLFEPFLLD